jgi:hypothetical protein
MVKRDFSAWDFVKQEPKKQGFTILGGGVGDLFTVVDNSADWVVTTTLDDTFTFNGYNNVVFGEGITIDGNTNNTVTISDMVVTGSADIPPTAGQMKTVSDGNSWNTQVFVEDGNGGEWVTISSTRLHRGVTTTENRWGRFKNWVGSVLS